MPDYLTADNARLLGVEEFNDRLTALERTAYATQADVATVTTTVHEHQTTYDALISRLEYAQESYGMTSGYYNDWPIVTYRNGILYAGEEPIGPLPLARSAELEQFWDGIEVHK